MDFYYLSFYCFTTSINLFYYLFLIYCVSNTISPVRTQNFLIDASWATLRVYHIFKNKCKTFIKRQIDTYLNDDIKHLLSKKEQIELERTFYIKDGNETNNLMDNSDMVLTFFNNIKMSDNTIPVLRTNEADSFSTALIDNKLCNFKFITILLIPNKNLKKQSISIDLSKPFNYYIEGNILLDHTFIKWYAKKYHQIDININDYAIEIFDNNANYIYLTCEHEIILNKEDYKVQASRIIKSNILDDNYKYKDEDNKNNQINTEDSSIVNTLSTEYEDADKVESENENENENESYSLRHRKSFDINLEN